MSDLGDDFKALREDRKERRARLGVGCPRCQQLQPKRHPTLLMPGARCRVDGYVDTRPDPDFPERAR